MDKVRKLHNNKEAIKAIQMYVQEHLKDTKQDQPQPQESTPILNNRDSMNKSVESSSLKLSELLE